MQSRRGVGLLLVTLLALASARAEAQVWLYPEPTPIPGGMLDLDIGSDGDVFAIGAASGPGSNNTIYTWIHGGWSVFPGILARRVAVDGRGRPWVLTNTDQVWRYDGASFVRVWGAAATAIDIGPSPTGDAVFIIRTSGQVARWNGSTFVDVPGGGGVEITVDHQGEPWIVNGIGHVWERVGTTWTYRGGITGRDIDVGADGSVYLLQGPGGSNGTIYRHNGGSSWTNIGGYGVRVAVSPTGTPAVINSLKEVWSGFARRLHGDASCGSGERDCNVCAFDVRGQFRAMFQYGKRTNVEMQWTFSWFTTYAPSNRTPNDAFEDGTWFPSGDHVQGFVRTGSIQKPYAGSYSDNTLGSVFVLERYAPYPRLRNIITSLGGEGHPSGAHALGHYVGVNESDVVRIRDIDAPATTASWTDSSGEIRTSGGGFGLARLGPSEYLVASTNPGGGQSGARSTHFWRYSGALNTSGAMTHLGGNDHRLLPGGSYNTNENLSLITECETGQLYAIHTSGDADIYGDGFWRVARVEQATNGFPVLRTLEIYAEGQNMENCHLRAAATAYAQDNGEIETYCHGYDARNDSWSSTDAIAFRRRPADYSASCLTSCGGAAPSGACWCDALCAGYGDCCSDKAAFCPE